jgi:Protein of unknown function (DUF732)
MTRRRGRHRAGPSRGVRVLRATGAVVVCVGAVLGATAFGPGNLPQSAAQVDERFVETVRAQGRTVGSGETEALVIRAAHKLCEGRDAEASSAERRANALTAEETDAVRRTFGDDSQAFMSVVLRTYCP